VTAVRKHNLLVLSDVHLGSDLVQHVRPEQPQRSATSEQRDQALVALLRWYQQRRSGGLSWRLVIGGDFVDFTGMSVTAAPGTVETEPTDEERTHGLGSARDHTLAKVKLVFEHHRPVMQALADFLAAGNSLVIVRGNHDVEWHWRVVQREFRRRLARLAPIARAQLRFAPWFYYEEGLVYVEHGHQYDAACSYEHVLFPVSPSDPRRTARSLADVLLRYVARPTPGMHEAGHETATLLDYLRFGARLGVRGLLALARRFAAANGALLRIWRESFGGAGRWVKRVHEQRLRALGLAYRISAERLHGLELLQRPPSTLSLKAILQSVMLDQVLLVLGGLACAGLVLATLPWPFALPGAGAVLAALEALRRASKRQRALEPSAALRESSARVAKLFPAAFVVMGHTHVPEMRPSADHATYVNLGAWAPEQPFADQRPTVQASQSHFVLVADGTKVSAQLRTWEGEAPRLLEGAPTRTGGRRDGEGE
jgi:UDP-2,3-diacylglucosamine pyrophosphatase LpxH